MLSGMVKNIFAPQLLNEGISEVIYHLTTAPREVLSTNTLLGSRSDWEDGALEIPKGKGWFLSAARALESRYIRNRISGNSVTLELDGNKIAQKYSGRPFDYFPEDDERFEYEDRVWLNSRAITPLDEYLTRIILVNPLRGDMSDWKNYRMLTNY